MSMTEATAAAGKNSFPARAPGEAPKGTTGRSISKGIRLCDAAGHGELRRLRLEQAGEPLREAVRDVLAVPLHALPRLEQRSPCHGSDDQPSVPPWLIAAPPQIGTQSNRIEPNRTGAEGGGGGGSNWGKERREEERKGEGGAM
ncbi:hypothetical protein EE612_005499, partial [Oryza sativa]